MATGPGRRSIILHGGPIGYVLAGEEHPAASLVENGARAEEAGFSFLFVSDHFHPWNSAQGHGSSLWPVLGALATSTRDIALVSAVTCPILRWDLSTLAQAAATVQNLSQGRFLFGLGTGENLNEHIAGVPWPPYSERLARLEEAVLVLRRLFTGDEVDHEGPYFKAHRSRLYDPPASIPLGIASSGPRSAGFAGLHGDALISLGADAETAAIFAAEGGEGKRKLTQISVCWGENAAQARALAHRLWPVVALPGNLFASLETPEDFERACAGVSQDEVSAAIVCGSRVADFREAIDSCLTAGFDGVALHHIGPDQSGFFKFAQREILPYYAR